MSDALRAAAQAVVDYYDYNTLRPRHEILDELRAELAKPQPEPVAFVFKNPVRLEFNPLYPISELPLDKNPLYAGDKP